MPTFVIEVFRNGSFLGYLGPGEAELEDDAGVLSLIFRNLIVSDPAEAFRHKKVNEAELFAKGNGVAYADYGLDFRAVEWRSP